MGIKIGNTGYIPYFGNKEISKIYLGNTLLYEKGEEPAPVIIRDYILSVQKVTRNTYVDSNTTYTDDNLLGFSVTAGSSNVTVTYGGVTKTVSAGTTEDVIFGKYKGVDDGTPSSGNITFSGDYTSVYPTTTLTAKVTNTRINCITGIVQYFGTQMTDTKYIMAEQTNITSFDLPNFVTNIGQYAFYNCSNLISVTFNNKITSVGNYAFYNCSKLESEFISFNKLTSVGSYAFSKCSKLTGNLTLSKISGNIGGYAFNECSKLTNTSTLNISNNCTGIGAYSFRLCGGLNCYVTLSSNITSIGEYAFENTSIKGNLSIPNSVTSMGRNAFGYCGGLTSVVIDNSVISIDSQAFISCYRLSTISLGTGITSIGNQAFYDCTGLTSITIPNSVTSIAKDAFNSCTNLSNVTIGSGVTSIGDSAFSRCTGLTSVYYTGAIAQWCNISFSNEYSNPLSNAHNLYIDNTLVTDLVIPDTVTEIKQHAFRNCTCLTGVTIPSSVTSIGNYAFIYCSKLLEVINKSSLTITAGSSDYGDIGYYAKQVIVDESQSKLHTIDAIIYYIDSSNNEYIAVSSTIANPTSITINNSCTEINAYAFEDCTNLTSVTIPNSVISLGNGAFRSCTGLISVTIGNGVTSIGGYVLQYCTGLTSVYFLHDYTDGIQTSSSSNPNFIGYNAFTGGNSNVIYYFINQASRDNAYNISDRSRYFTGSNFEVMS